LFQENLVPYLISEKIISPSVGEELDAATTSLKKAQIVLFKISSSLQSGYTELFYKLLKIMKLYGSIDLQKLTAIIESEVTGTSVIGDAGLFHLCSKTL